MKTLHRLMYENLTPEEYKEFCKCKIYRKSLTIDYSSWTYTMALLRCLDWHQQHKEYSYWYNIYRKAVGINYKWTKTR